MFRAFAVAAVAATLSAVPAAAVTYDAFSSFNGTQGAGNFTYGITDGTTFTPFAVTSNCFIAGSTCLQLAANNDVPGVTKSAATSFQYGSVNVPNDRLLLHPGNSDTQSVYVMFTATVAGNYSLEALATVQDINPSGVGITFFLAPIGPGGFQTALTTLDSQNTSFSYSNGGFLAVGESVGLIFDRNGTFNNDSTGLNISLSTVDGVPEPASWAMLIAGFGLTGAAMRRRAAATRVVAA